MKGEFFKQKRFFIGAVFLSWSVLVVRFGVWFVQGIRDGENVGNLIGCGCACAFCFLLGLLWLFCLRLNKGAYLTLTPETLHARYGWGKEITVDYVNIKTLRTSYMTLHITTKQNKTYQISALSNVESLYFYITHTEAYLGRQVTVADAENIPFLKQKRKRFLIVACAMIVLSFVWIGATVALTGGRDVSDFGKRDIIVFCGFLIVETATIALMLIFASKAGRMKNRYDDAMWDQENEMKTEDSVAEIKDAILRRYPSVVKALVSEYFGVRVIFYLGDISERYRFVIESYSEYAGWMLSFGSGCYECLEQAERAAWEMLSEDVSEDCDVIF